MVSGLYTSWANPFPSKGVKRTRNHSLFMDAQSLVKVNLLRVLGMTHHISQWLLCSGCLFVSGFWFGLSSHRLLYGVEYTDFFFFTLCQQVHEFASWDRDQSYLQHIVFPLPSFCSLSMAFWCLNKGTKIKLLRNAFSVTYTQQSSSTVWAMSYVLF